MNEFEAEYERRVALEARVLILEAAVGRLTGERNEAVSLLKRIDAQPCKFQEGGDAIEEVHTFIQRFDPEWGN